MTDRNVAPLRLPAATPTDAAELAAVLTNDVELDGITVDGNDVLVPWGGDARFAWDLATMAAGHCHDDALANAITTALRDAGHGDSQPPCGDCESDWRCWACTCSPGSWTP